MACGIALKRSIDLEGLHSPEHSIKRRRTSNVCHHSPYQPAATGFAPASHIREKSPPTVSEFAACKISTEELYAAIREELCRRRTGTSNLPNIWRRVSPSSSPSASPTCSNGSSYRRDSFSVMSTEEPSALLTSSPTLARPTPAAESLHDMPLFTFKQVQAICDRLLKEQESRLCAEYDKILNARLSEQYDSFVRFTYDQIHRRLEDAPMSYLS